MKTTDELADGSVAGGHSKEPLAWDRWAFRGFVAGVLVLVGSAVAITVTELDGVPLELGAFVARVFESSFVVPLAWASLGSLALGSLISLIQHWLPRRSERKARALGTLAPTGLRELLVEVGARTREALAGDEPDVSLAIDELLRGALSVEA
ncbi:MAG TPA: hypothetical protein VLC09_11380, partial [Polyangiaceae bacterium]|nr:hypothetical protein [Polyangiaceae bacterium]